ncbi:MAG: hypothetical protein ACI835_003813, partial [Planctomycetota bacterium]
GGEGAVCALGSAVSWMDGEAFACVVSEHAVKHSAARSALSARRLVV